MLALNDLEVVKEELQEIVKPFQQEQNRRQKKSDFLKKCIKSIEKNDFFQLDELLKSQLSRDILEDPYFEKCLSIFGELQTVADEKINEHWVVFKKTLLELAEGLELPLEVDIPRFSVLKGIEGKIDFASRKTTINQITLKSIDPKRIISTSVKIKRKLYDGPFDPQNFIDSLLECYKKILGEENPKGGNIVSIRQLYCEYVWSLQSNAFFQNMDKGKFKGYAIDQFAVDFWRFFESKIPSAKGGYRVRLNSGRGNSLWMIDQDGEKRQITHALFIKN